MTPRERIETAESEAEDIRRVAGEALADPVAQQQARSIQQAADRLREIAAGRVSVGLVGGFGVGKTELLEVLIGHEGTFPRGEFATTGNVVGVIFRQTNERTGTLQSHRVIFLSESELVDCVAFLADRLGLPSARAELEADRRDGWRKLKASASALVAAKDRVRDGADAEQLLAVLAADIPAHHRLLGSDRPFRLDEADSYIRIGPDQHPAFPLVRRVEFIAGVPSEVWRLAELGDHELEIVDFPGWGAVGSSHRDSFLFTHEIPNLSAVCLLINGQHPGEAGDATLVQELRLAQQTGVQRNGDGRADRSSFAGKLVVVVNKFDGADHRAAAVLRHGDRPVRDADVLAVESIKKLVTHARALSGDLSVPLLLSTGASHPDTQGRPEIRSRIAEAQEVWKAIAERMSATSPSDLARVLAAYGRGGGLDAVRATLARLLNDRGLEAVARNVELERTRLHREVDQMVALIGGDNAAPPQEHPEVTELGDAMSTTLRDHEAALSRVAIMPEIGGGGLRQFLEEEATKYVARWSVWDELARVVQDGYLGSVRAMTGEEFVDDFVKACNQTSDAGRQEVAAEMDRWRTELTNELTPQAKRLNELSAEHLGPSGPRLVSLVHGRATAGLPNDPTAAPIDRPPSRAEEQFPLARDRRLPWAIDPSRAHENPRHVIDLARARRQLIAAVADSAEEQAIEAWQEFRRHVGSWLSTTRETKAEIVRQIETQAPSTPGADATARLADRLRRVAEPATTYRDPGW